MSEPLPDLDLKFLPEWLKEGAKENRYADYRGEPEDDRRRDGGRGREGRGGPRGDRPGGRGPRPPGGGGGPRREGGGPPRGDRPHGGGGRGERRGDDRRGGPRRDRDDRPPRPASPPPVRVEVKVEFLPEPNGAAGIARQIKQSARAYPLFGTGRLFLERPERHRVRITSVDPNIPLYQIGDGPISPDRATVERDAFRVAREQYYREDVVQGEPIKGNFTNVARSRTTGVLLGPTNYHAYQPALRRLFEERFSRRMSFPEFLGREIEIVTDEQTINDWKEQARSTTTYVTTEEAEPITFKTAFDAEQHFRKHYLAGLLKSGYMLECSGQASRALPDRSLGFAVRDAWEKERPFPQQLVNNLRPYLVEQGLHFFKHRKRVLYVSAIRPVRHAAGQDFAPGIAAILNTVEAHPRCTRRDLAVKILGETHEAPEVAEQKAALARDLHYLIHAGHVIEFHDGTLDLPLIPAAQQQPQGAKNKGSSKEATLAGGEAFDVPEAAAESLSAGGEAAAPAPVEGELAPAETPETAMPDAVAPELHSGVQESASASSFDAENAPAAGEISAPETAPDALVSSTQIADEEPSGIMQEQAPRGGEAVGAVAESLSSSVEEGTTLLASEETLVGAPGSTAASLPEPEITAPPAEEAVIAAPASSLEQADPVPAAEARSEQAPSTDQQ